MICQCLWPHKNNPFLAIYKPSCGVINDGNESVSFYYCKKSFLKYLHKNAFSISNNKFVFFNADISSVSQPTVSRAIAEVLDALSTQDMIRQFIRFPRTREELRRTSLEFHGLAGFPKVLLTNNKTPYNFVVFVS